MAAVVAALEQVAAVVVVASDRTQAVELVSEELQMAVPVDRIVAVRVEQVEWKEPRTLTALEAAQMAVPERCLVVQSRA